MQVQTLGQEDPLEKEMATHSSILAWEIHGQRRPVSYSPWGRKASKMTAIKQQRTSTANIIDTLVSMHRGNRSTE